MQMKSREVYGQSLDGPEGLFGWWEDRVFYIQWNDYA